MAHPKIAIIGAGPSGICIAVHLQRYLDIHDFVIFDENQDVGGVWLVNTYPGCACDVPCHLYSFSFAPNPRWSKLFAERPELLKYFQSVAKSNNVYPKVRFGHRVKKATWLEKKSKWSLIVSHDGKDKEQIFDIIISCIGPLRLPNYPPEFEAFQRPKIHSARWDDSIDLANKKVGIVGTGASAVQIIPEIAKQVKELVVFQRKPPWVIPRYQFEFPSWMKWGFTYVPGMETMFRYSLFWSYELSHAIYMKDSWVGGWVASFAKSHLNNQYKKTNSDELVPKYRIGCKRITPSDDYYKALNRENVRLVTRQISKVGPTSLSTDDGNEEELDVLILATGFKPQELFYPMEIIGKDSTNLYHHWKKNDPSTYRGTCSSLLPNCFFVIGPNSVPGHTSALFGIECQSAYIMRIIEGIISNGWSSVQVKESAEKDQMSKIQADLEKTVWTLSCGNYFTNERGVVTGLVPYGGVRLWWELLSIKWEDFETR